MDDSWSPVQGHAKQYWSVEECRWLPSPVEQPALPQQRTDDEPAVEPTRV